MPIFNNPLTRGPAVKRVRPLQSESPLSIAKPIEKEQNREVKKIIRYSSDEIRNFAGKVADSYEKKLTKALMFNNWRADAYNLMFGDPERFNIKRIGQGEHVRIAPPTAEMLRIVREHLREKEEISLNAPPEKKDRLLGELFRKLLQPIAEFDYVSPMSTILVDGEERKVPTWFNSTVKSVNIRTGFDNGDSSTPTAISLDSDRVHMMLGGTTGAGKSVALNTIICNLLVEYPPWEVDIYLMDFKVVEGVRYANRIPTPHMKIVAATGSTEFTMSAFDLIKQEIIDRQELCSLVGCQNITDFRNNFNLVLPRCILVVDEFTQMYMNISQSESKGNDHASEDKAFINNTISELARLGRSWGMHMLLSSQQLDVLDDSIIGNFQVGVALYCTSAISNSLIGNDAGSQIRGKGKCIYNTRKINKDAADNVMSRVPYLKSDLSLKEIESGALTMHQEIMQEMYKLSQNFPFKKELLFYDETAPIPYQLFVDDLANSDSSLRELKERYAQSFTDLKETVWCSTHFMKLMLGRAIKLTKKNYCEVDVEIAEDCNFVVDAKEETDQLYVLKILQENFKLRKARHTVIAGDIATTKLGKFDMLPNCTIKTKLEFPKVLLTRVKTRDLLLRYQSVLTENGKLAGWYSTEAIQTLGEEAEKLRKGMELNPSEFEELADLIVQLDGDLPEVQKLFGLENSKGGQLSIFGQKIMMIYKQYTNLWRAIGAPKEGIRANDFGLDVIWLLGFENFSDIKDYEGKGRWKQFFNACSKTNTYCVITGKRWESTGPIVNTQRYVLEKTEKSFFINTELPRNININPNSFQFHDRLTREHIVISQYSRLEP